MSENFYRKAEQIKNFFLKEAASDKYSALIELGKQLPPYPTNLQTPDRLVSGCQSKLYLNAELKEGKVFFQACADALISAGLAAVLIFVYSGETPQTVLTLPPDYLKELELTQALSPSRSNGLYNVHLRMRQEALKKLVSPK